MYTIINDKKYNIITCRSFKKRFMGLMFRKKIISDIYMFPKCSKIHTFFMRQNIDICILDKSFNIIYLCYNVGKNRLILKKGYYTLEMPSGLSKYLALGEELKI